MSLPRHLRLPQPLPCLSRHLPLRLQLLSRPRQPRAFNRARLRRLRLFRESPQLLRRRLRQFRRLSRLRPLSPLSQLRLQRRASRLRRRSQVRDR